MTAASLEVELKMMRARPSPATYYFMSKFSSMLNSLAVSLPVDNKERTANLVTSTTEWSAPDSLTFDN